MVKVKAWSVAQACAASSPLLHKLLWEWNAAKETVIFLVSHCLFQETWEPSRRRFIGLKCKPWKSTLLVLMKMWFWSLLFPVSPLPWEMAGAKIYGNSDLRGQEVQETGDGGEQGDRPLPDRVYFPEEKIMLPAALVSTVLFLNTERFVTSLEIA